MKKYLYISLLLITVFIVGSFVNYCQTWKYDDPIVNRSQEMEQNPDTHNYPPAPTEAYHG